MAIEGGALVVVSVELVIETGETFLDFLVGSGHGEEAEVGSDVVVEGETVNYGEDPVEKSTDLGGTGGKLLNLDTILAGDILIIKLDDEVVDHLEEDLAARASGVPIEVVNDIESLISDLINEIVGLIHLFVAGG